MQLHIIEMMREVLMYGSVKFNENQEEERFRMMSALETLGIPYNVSHEPGNEFPFTLTSTELINEELKLIERFPVCQVEVEGTQEDDFIMPEIK